MIYTFYSYKGGVGRTMALANIAELFYQAGLRALMVDWDLEAPGLERYFPSIGLQDILDKPGVIDMLLRYKEQMAQELDDDALFILESPAQYIIDVYPNRTGPGKLFLLTAGRRSKPYFTEYAKAVATFDWQDFYESWEGELYFNWLREQFESIADAVLIDSRTGVTEMGGVCTYHLADIVVMFCTPNQQSFDGTHEMARNLKQSDIQELRGGRPLEILIVPARVEDRAEIQFLNEFRRQFFEKFGEFLPGILEGGVESLWRLKIPYVPYYAFSEAVAVRGQSESWSEDMITAFVSLEEVMLRLAGTKLISRLAENERVQKQTPASTPTFPVRVFICHQWNVHPDQNLASYLHESLMKRGYEVFVDVPAAVGEVWIKEIDQQIKTSDFLIVLLSKESADSEMVRAEVSRAYEYRSLQGKPRTLPIRIAHGGLLPYSIAAFVDPLQYVVWQSDADNERVTRDIIAAIEGLLPAQELIQVRPLAGRLTLSEDGRIISDDERLYPPLPEFDPRFLEGLEAPGGAVKLRDAFYVERDADARLKREVVKSGTTTTIRAARQTGKSSLLVRGVHYARQNGAQAVAIDMQSVAREYMETTNVLLRYLTESIVRRLRLDMADVEELWSGPLGPLDKMTYLMEDYVLPLSDGPIVLALDEADRLLDTDFYQDFFAMVRSWHNNRAFNDQWSKLNIVMAISTEPYLLIPDVNQSPFNVGLRLYLEDFNDSQVHELNRRHGAPVEERDFPQLMELLGGHPYLIRKALYTLVTERLTWANLVRVATTDQGPFGDHLRRDLWLLHNEPDLREALKQVVHHNRCPDEMAFFRLLRAGLVKGSGDACKCRCELYRMYFEDKLR